MTIPVVVTMRSEFVPDRSERRDALDRKVIEFLRACGCTPCPVPNDPGVAVDIWRLTGAAAVVLSGGGSIAALDGHKGARDQTEHALLEEAYRCDAPAVGFCRGFQAVVAQAGGTLARVQGHIASRHLVLAGATEREVNSFHEWGVTRLPEGWWTLARDPDGRPEAAWDPIRQVGGLMWHPEREAQPAAADVTLVRSLLTGTVRR